MSRARNPFTEYFANLWAGIVTTFVGMRLTLHYCLREKPVTMEYPEVRPVVPETYRGIHGFDESKCAVCKACAAACPVDCITIEHIGRGKDAMLTRFDIDYGKCLFCELCTVPCPVEAIFMTTQYDLARPTRNGCVLHFARPKTPEELAAHDAMLAQKEVEKKAKAAEAAAAKAKADAEKKVAEAKPVTEQNNITAKETKDAEDAK